MKLEKENYTLKDYFNFLEYLKSLKEEKYKLFTTRLVKTNHEILGIRIPILKKISKEIALGNIESFLDQIKSYYHEEILIEGFLISKLKDIKKSKKYFLLYLDKIDNWSVCDSFCSSYKIIKNNKEYFYPIIIDLINTNKTYHIRVGVVLLLNYYIQEDYLQDIFKIVNNISSDEYYVSMAVAWLLSICYIKYKKQTINYFNYNQLPKITYQRTINKIIESNQVDLETKMYFKEIKKKITSF